MARKLLILFIFSSLAALTPFAQSIVTVNNTPGEPATFSSLQDAVNTVPDGTIILLQPGPMSYGNIIISKRVTIIGSGYFLGLNPEPFTQASLQSSVTGWITFAAGSNGSQLMGLSLTGDGTTNGTRDRLTCNNTSNITISRCLIYPYNGTSTVLYAYQSSGIRIRQCHIKIPGGGMHGRILGTRESSGIEYSNSIFENDGFPYYGFMMPTEHFTNYTASVMFRNNIMFHIHNPGFYPSANTLINNIIIQPAGAHAILCEGADRNVGNAQFTAQGGTNITNAALQNICILNSGSVSFGPDGKYQLIGGSPAIGYGQGGIDCGPFGGPGAYVLSGIPLVPNVYSSELQGTPSTTGGLRLRLKVHANQ